jgi:glyoxylase-like metal-dependent hydrolase (beta-lactamase superfamily II)
MEPRDVSLVLLTHGHADHFGSAAELKRLTGAPVAVHERDAEAVRRGRNPYLPPTRLQGRLLKPFLPHSAPAVEPDVLLRGEVDLEEFGAAGRVIGTPGHTAGSMSVLVPGTGAIVGDVLMGGHLGGAFRPAVPRYHYFAEDLAVVRASIERILDHSPTRLYVGHGGPLDPAAVRTRFGREYSD